MYNCIIIMVIFIVIHVRYILCYYEIHKEMNCFCFFYDKMNVYVMILLLMVVINNDYLLLSY